MPAAYRVGIAHNSGIVPKGAAGEVDDGLRGTANITSSIVLISRGSYCIAASALVNYAVRFRRHVWNGSNATAGLPLAGREVRFGPKTDLIPKPNPVAHASCPL